jgi:hypothetical protein
MKKIPKDKLKQYLYERKSFEKLLNIINFHWVKRYFFRYLVIKCDFFKKLNYVKTR